MSPTLDLGARWHTVKISGASLIAGTQVAHLELQGLRLINVALWVSGLDIQVVDAVVMKCLGFLARQDVREPGRVGEAEDAPSGFMSVWRSGFGREQKGKDLRGLVLRRAHDRNTLRHHHLVPGLGVQVARAHKTRLRGVGMDPTNHY